MAHSTSLRAIGQSLEILGVESFIVEKDGPSYVVTSDALPLGSELVFRPRTVEDAECGPGSGSRPTSPPQALYYDPIYIAWLNAQGRRRRRRRFSSQVLSAKRLSQLLRTIGKHLDRLDTTGFTLSWRPGSISLEYRTSAGERVHEGFTVDQLVQLGLRMRFRRTRRRR